MIVLYDADCGFCRWAMAWALKHDPAEAIVALPIQSRRGSEALVDLTPSERLRSAHVIREDGSRRSGGAAAAEVLGALPATQLLGRVARSLPRAADLLYGVVAARRKSFGRFVGADARRSADELLLARAAAEPLGLGSGSIAAEGAAPRAARPEEAERGG